MSFVWEEDDYPFKIAKKKPDEPDHQIIPVNMVEKVAMKEFGISMNILGLRGLMSPGLLPIKKAFLNFNLKSMVPPQIGDSLENIRTEPKMAGSDPTLNTLIEFNLLLPVQELFTPRLACTVFDSIAMGLQQPTVGNFVIDVGKLMRDLAEERERETEDLRKVVLNIKKYVMGEAVAASMRTKMAAVADDMVKKQ